MSDNSHIQCGGCATKCSDDCFRSCEDVCVESCHQHCTVHCAEGCYGSCKHECGEAMYAVTHASAQEAFEHDREKWRMVRFEERYARRMAGEKLDYSPDDEKGWNRPTHGTTA